MEGPALLETAPKAVKAAVSRPARRIELRTLDGADGRPAGMDVRRLRDGAVPAHRRTGAQRSAWTRVGRAGDAMVRRDHRRVPRRRRDRRRVFRLARRSHRPRPRDGAEHLHLRGVHRTLRLRDRSVAHRGAAVRRLARHGRRMVARRGARQRNLAEQIARADRGADRRRRESRISHGRPAQHRPAQLHRRRRSAAARHRHADGDGRAVCSRTPDGAS